MILQSLITFSLSNEKLINISNFSRTNLNKIFSKPLTRFRSHSKNISQKINEKSKFLEN